MSITSKHFAISIIPLLVITIMSMSFGSAYAHTMDVAGDYKIEIGWDQEPPIQGISNAIELVVTHATEEDKKQAEEMRGMMMDMGNSMDNQMSMGEKNVGGYEEEIISILNQFDSNKIISSAAISQISQIINDQKSYDDLGQEIRSLIDDAHSGVLTDEDALYVIIDMLGTEVSNEMDHVPTMDHMDMAHDETMAATEDHGDEEGIPGLAETIHVTVTLDGKESILNMIETQVGGIYLGEFTPESAGFTVVHISGMMHDTTVDLDMHPEEVESISILPPLKQLNQGIEPSNVQCKEGLQLFMRTHVESAICASDVLGQRLMALGIVEFY